MKNLYLLILLIYACGTEKRDAVRTVDTFPDLQTQKDDVYLKKAKRVQDKYGWIETDKCDALLFTGLAYASGLKGVDLLAGREPDGRWQRRPQGNCYGFIQGSTSRDMLIGLMWAAYATGNEEILNDLYEYGKEHNWKMGDGDIDTVYLTPNFVNTLRVLIGKSANLPEIWIDPQKDHQRHVVALNIILRGEKQGHINDQMLHLLRVFRNKQPKNALFHYGVHRFSDGDQASAISILRDESIFPADRLPTSRDRCGRWAWERREWSDNWLPCPEEKNTHSGGDFTFILMLLEGSLL
jgi:hypothetical protein